MKKEKIKQILISIALFIPSLLAAIYYVLFKQAKAENGKLNAESKKEDIEDEIKNTDAADLVAESSNSEVISTNIEREKEQFRERVRDRLKQKL